MTSSKVLPVGPRMEGARPRRQRARVLTHNCGEPVTPVAVSRETSGGFPLGTIIVSGFLDAFASSSTYEPLFVCVVCFTSNMEVSK